MERILLIAAIVAFAAAVVLAGTCIALFTRKDVAGAVGYLRRRAGRRGKPRSCPGKTREPSERPTGLLVEESSERPTGLLAEEASEQPTGVLMLDSAERLAEALPPAHASANPIAVPASRQGFGSALNNVARSDERIG